MPPYYSQQQPPRAYAYENYAPPAPAIPEVPELPSNSYFDLSHLIRSFADSVDALPPTIQRSLSDLKELDAVLRANVNTLAASLTQLDKMMHESDELYDAERPTSTNAARLSLLKQICDQLKGFKPGSDDRTRVAAAAGETLQSGIDQLSILARLTKDRSSGLVFPGPSTSHGYSEGYSRAWQAAALRQSTRHGNIDSHGDYHPHMTAHDAQRRSSALQMVQEFAAGAPGTSSTTHAKVNQYARATYGEVDPRHYAYSYPNVPEKRPEKQPEEVAPVEDSAKTGAKKRRAVSAKKSAASRKTVTDSNKRRKKVNNPKVEYYDDFDAEDQNQADESSHVYCTCRKNNIVSDMIGCDGEGCEIEWFHLHCVGLSESPDGEWRCDDCIQHNRPVKKRQDDEE